jgi:hypothetical protein
MAQSQRCVDAGAGLGARLLAVNTSRYLQQVLLVKTVLHDRI